MADDKRPRHWAAEIASLTTREARQKALEQVPEEFKALVITHVKITFFVNKYRK